MAFSIGKHSFENPVVLAPMSGITDAPYRNLCLEQGAALAYSEMVHSDIKLYKSNKTRHRLTDNPSEKTRAVQIVGYCPDMMAEAARYQEDHGARIIDINMGCPAKKVCSRAAGSALLADPQLVQSILHKVIASVSIPVTLKIRTGITPETRNAIEIARIATEEGVQALTIHGRTRQDRFKGRAEYDTIRSVRDVTNIPIIANGDITCGIKAKEVLANTGADAVMIGRASQGNPWVFGKIVSHLNNTDNKTLGVRSKLNSIAQHISNVHELYGIELGVKIARKHMSWYLEHLKAPTDIKKNFNWLTSHEQQNHFITNLVGDCRLLGETAHDC